MFIMEVLVRRFKLIVLLSNTISQKNGHAYIHSPGVELIGVSGEDFHHSR